LLERFYSKLGLTLPAMHELSGESMPQPYRSLLVHSLDMTPTLESFYRQPMNLSVLSREQQDYAYLREVVLKCSGDRRPVEYGVIRISLNHLPGPASLRVLEEQRPLGNILQTEAIAHLSWPQAFFKIQSDPHLAHVLHCPQPEELYGRRNVLLDGSRRLLAEVIEILAPVP
jgi:chorismate-pyruvate lyase